MNSTGRIVLSFLGTGNYQQTTYQWGSKQHTTPYFADAINQFFVDHQLKVVMTREAQDEHGQLLSEVCEYEPLIIPSGQSQSELWEMFDLIETAIPEGCSLVVDVTHGFRSQPMIALAICVYLRTVKQVEVERIVYGAYEATDEHGLTPVFDLTPFLDLIDWSMAAHQFQRHGNAIPMKDLLQAIHTQSHIDTDHYKAQGLSTLGNRLSDFSRASAMIRPQEILDNSQQVLNALEKARQDLENLDETRPFSAILETVKQRVAPFANQQGLFSRQGFDQQANMIEFYLQTEQYPQAITLAREAIVSKVCTQLQQDPLEKEGRKQAEDYLNTLAHGQRRMSQSGAEREVANLWLKVGEIRNDIDHAGMRTDPIPANTAVGNTKQYCEEVAAWLRR
ncbi:MAG: TIGR02221 family CRISPR-associated protein [Salinibacter sp.]